MQFKAQFMLKFDLHSQSRSRVKDNTEITTVACSNKQQCLMSEDRLPLYCTHNGVVAMATWRYDRNSRSGSIFLQVLQRQTELCLKARFSIKNNPTRKEKYKRLLCWYYYTVVPFG